MPVALLLLDPSGRIRHANQDACVYFGCEMDDLLQRRFVDLFAFEIVQSEASTQADHWEAVLAESRNGPFELPLSVKQAPGSVVEVQLQELNGLHAGYAALLIPPKPAQAERGPEADMDVSPLSLIQQHGEFAVFDLNFREGRTLYSTAWKKMLGYADAELPDSYDTWLRLLHPDDSSAAPDHIGRRAAEAGTAPFSLEYRMRHRDGSWVWIQCQGVRETGGDGRTARVVGIHYDVTERKELEETSLLNEERLRGLGGMGQLGLFDADFSAGTAWFSEGLKALAGYSGEEIVDSVESLRLLLKEPGEDEELAAAAWFSRRCGHDKTVFSIVARLAHRDGRSIPVVMGGQCRYSRRRELQRVIGYCCQIPAGAASPEVTVAGASCSEPLLAEAVSFMSEGLLVTDEKGNVRFANETAARLLQVRNVDALVSQPVRTVFRLLLRDGLRAIETDVTEMACSAEAPMNLVQAHALALPSEDAAPIPIVWSARVVHDSDSRPCGVLVVFRNPEEMSLSPEELVKANRYETLALLAGGIAHDFNNLLTTILGGISLARDNRDYTALDDSDKSCIAAKALTKQLLAFVKGGVGVRTVCTAREILNDAVKIAAAGSSAQVTISASDSLPAIKVDRPQMLQVFQNLIVNALQAMPPPPHKAKLMLGVSTCDVAEGQLPPLQAGTYLKYEVRDNGSGIGPAILEKIWDPFFTTKRHGTGLGLATVLSIVRRHGGQIGVESQVGIGTVFTVFLPASASEIELPARQAPTLRYGTGRILFMDDDPKICSLTANMLQSLNYKFDLANSGEEAVKLYRSYFNIGRPYDVVIMDLTVIGGMGGEDAFRELRKLDPDVRAIACSGYDNEEIARKYLEMGFCGYLTKPYRVTELGKILRTVLG